MSEQGREAYRTSVWMMFHAEAMANHSLTPIGDAERLTEAHMAYQALKNKPPWEMDILEDD